MKPEELEIGKYIHWSADRMFKGWDVYGKVINIGEKDFTVITFDDFKETTLSKTGEALKFEIMAATKENALAYIELKIINLTHDKAIAELSHKKQILDIDNKISSLEEHINKV